MRQNPPLDRYLASRASLVERELRRLLRARGKAPISFLAPAPKSVARAMAYSLLAGGKRLRPTLAMAAAECCGLPGRRVLKTACALEMIHTYSLIHDDLPAMDDDDLRRGKPTSHKMFGEALAILAGDGLLTWAFEVAALNARELGLNGAASADLIGVIASGAGARGMVCGQAADIDAEGWTDMELRNGRRGLVTPEGAPCRVRQSERRGRARRLLDYIHTHKTAALITASLEAGAVLAGASGARRRALREYGRCVGLAFQIADDVLDRVGDKRKLGKRGSDADNGKLTYPRLYGIDASRTFARELAARARAALSIFRDHPAAGALRGLAEFVVTRDK